MLLLLSQHAILLPLAPQPGFHVGNLRPPTIGPFLSHGAHSTLWLQGLTGDPGFSQSDEFFIYLSISNRYREERVAHIGASEF